MIMEWQPIETAPHDQDILVFSKKHGAAKATFAFAMNNVAEWVVITYDTCCCDYYDDVTHWMPLPPPPTGAA